MLRKILILIVVILLIAACEPLAPEVTQQVIIITNTPTQTAEVPIVTQTAVAAANAVPTRPPVTPTLTPRPTNTLPPLPTSTVNPCDDSQGELFESAFNSEIVGGLVTYNVYLPPCFFNFGRRYPYVILMHGSNYRYDQWADLGIKNVLDEGITNQSIAPMVVIMPDGGDFQENNIFTEGASYEDIILNELIPEIELNYCVWSEARARAIGGISRGGFWAYSISFRHPDMFTAVGGHSPWFVPNNAPNTHNPLALAEFAPEVERLRMYLDNAQNDTGGANVVVFSNELSQRGIAHIYTINPTGGHNNDYWSVHLQEYLEFYGRNWPILLEDLPSCQ